MRKCDRESAIIVIELHQLTAEFAHEIDFNSDPDTTEFYTEDGTFAVGDYTHRGHAAIRKFYAEREQRIPGQHKDGIRVAVHTFLNPRVEVQDKDNATIFFTNVNYAGEGHPPVLGTIQPAMVTVCRMVCRRETDGIWRIAWFSGTPLFVGNDPFVNKALLKA